MKLSNQPTNRTYLLIIIILAVLFIGGLLIYQGLFKFPEQGEIKIIMGKSTKEISISKTINEKEAALNIPSGWWFPGGDAPASYLMFREDGVLELPYWFSEQKVPIELDYNYDVNNEILTIGFKSYPEIFPRNPEDFFGDPSLYPEWAKLVEYDRQNLSVKLRINEETRAIGLSGWVFYRVSE